MFPLNNLATEKEEAFSVNDINLLKMSRQVELQNSTGISSKSAVYILKFCCGSSI